MRENLLILSMIGILYPANVSIFFGLFLLAAVLSFSISHKEFIIFSLLMILALALSFASMTVKNNLLASLSSNLITILPVLLIFLCKNLDFRRLKDYLPFYIIGTFLYVLLSLVTVDYNVWSLRHSETFLIVGWPSNSAIFAFFCYFMIDESRLNLKSQILLKVFCIFLILVTLNRASIIGICGIVAVDLIRLTVKKGVLGLIGMIIVFICSAYSYVQFESISGLFRISDALNYNDSESSLGFRLLVLWPLALEFISSNLLLGSGGLGLGNVLSSVGGSREITIENVFIDALFRYGVLFGSALIGFYVYTCARIVRNLSGNSLIYPLVASFILIFSLNDALRYPHVIIAFILLYCYANHDREISSIHN